MTHNSYDVMRAIDRTRASRTRFQYPQLMARALILCATCVHVAFAYTAYSECDPTANGACTVGHPGGLQGKLRVAIAQLASNSTTTLEENAAKHAAWVTMAAKEGARVVLFPELSMTGYFAERVVTLAGTEGDAAAANQRLREAEDVVASAAGKHNVYAIIGVPVFFANVSKNQTRPWYNTALVISPNGKRLYRQAKLYPCCAVDGHAGSWLDVFNLTNFDGYVIPVATQVCFDDFHPEIVRLQAMAGAQVLFYMSWESDVSMEGKLSLGDKLASAQSVVNAHAAVNQLFVVQANAGALVDNMRTEWDAGYNGPAAGGSHGQSRVVDPNGITLEEARIFGQQLLIHDLDLSLLAPQRRRMVMGSKSHAVFGPMWDEGLKRFGRMPIEW